jgi:hypothetical protein
MAIRRAVGYLNELDLKTAEFDCFAGSNVVNGRLFIEFMFLEAALD